MMSGLLEEMTVFSLSTMYMRVVFPNVPKTVGASRSFAAFVVRMSSMARALKLMVMTPRNPAPLLSKRVAE